MHSILQHVLLYMVKYFHFPMFYTYHWITMEQGSITSREKEDRYFQKKKDKQSNFITEIRDIPLIHLQMTVNSQH